MSQNTYSYKYEIQFIHVSIIFCYNQIKLWSHLTPCSSFLFEKLNHTTNQEIFHTLQNHRLITCPKNLLRGHMLGQMNPLHILTLPSIRSILIQYSTYHPTYTYLSQAASSLHAFHLNFYTHFSHIHPSYMLHHSHPASFDHPNHTW